MKVADEKRVDLCVKCGRCCTQKFVMDNGLAVAFKDRYCPFLDRGNKRCMVYSYRHVIRPRCQTGPQMLRKGLLPNDCPNAKATPGYRSAVDVWEGEGEGAKSKEGEG